MSGGALGFRIAMGHLRVVFESLERDRRGSHQGSDAIHRTSLARIRKPVPGALPYLASPEGNV